MTTLPAGWSLERLTAILVRGGVNLATATQSAPFDPLDFLPPSTMNIEMPEGM